jgi:hypothetical protein
MSEHGCKVFLLFDDCCWGDKAPGGAVFTFTFTPVCSGPASARADLPTSQEHLDSISVVEFILLQSHCLPAPSISNMSTKTITHVYNSETFTAIIDVSM